MAICTINYCTLLNQLGENMKSTVIINDPPTSTSVKSTRSGEVFKLAGLCKQLPVSLVASDYFIKLSENVKYKNPYEFLESKSIINITDVTEKNIDITTVEYGFSLCCRLSDFEIIAINNGILVQIKDSTIQIGKHINES